MPDRPEKIKLYSYDVYFGDCFLLIFEYAQGRKSVLMDFGSTGKGKTQGPDADKDEESTGERMLTIANHIKETCGGKLDVVVATHRHKDHIYGFGLKEPGRIIRECLPELVIQPWTENPDDNRDLTKKALVDANGFKASPHQNFANMLNDMHNVAEAIENEAENLSDGSVFAKPISAELRDKIVFAADDNKVKNRKAVDNLNAMGSPPTGESHYVCYGYDKIDWEKFLPGVKVHILGPPTLEQSDEITSATSSSDEFWSLQAMNKYFWGVQSATTSAARGGTGKPLFGSDKVMKTRPANVRWFIRQLRNIRANQLLEIVRFVDGALNNTSVILLFEVDDQKLLFPGDAQIENWQYALKMAKSDAKISKLLTETTLYKVGHHGSRNATPKSLWDGFEKKSKQEKNNRLRTVISTMEGKHGETPDTAVPLPKMVTAMKAESTYTSTEEIKNGFFNLVEIEL